MVKANNLVINKNIKVNNEYFPSLSFNFIKNKKIELVKSFSHVGSPEYYEIFKKWNDYYFNKKDFLKKIKKFNFADEIIIPAAGNSSRFLKENIKTPKYLIKLSKNNDSMIEFITKYLKSKKKIRLITVKKNKKLSSKFDLYLLPNKTDGQADTVFKILNKVPENKSMYINSCDTFSIFDLEKFKALKKKSDIIVFATNNYETDSNTSHGSWIKYNKYQQIKKIYLKSNRIKNTSRLTGNFYFKNKEIFIKCFNNSKKKLINNEIFIDTLVQGAIKLNYKVSVMVDQIYVNMGTPKLLKEFNYWNNCFE